MTHEVCLDGLDLAEAVRDPAGTDLLVNFGFTAGREPSQFTCVVTWEDPE